MDTGIRLFIDPLPGDRGQLMADVLDTDGTVVVTYAVGSPALRRAIVTAFPSVDLA